MGLYLNAPIDHIKLQEDVLKKNADLKNQILNLETLQKMTEDLGIDATTMALKIWLEESPAQKKFLIDLKCDTPTVTPADDVQFVLLPALFYEKYPDVGAGGEHILQIAKRLQLNIQRAPVKSQGSVSTNGKIIAQYLEDHPSQKIVVMSLSKGTLDFRYAWENLLSPSARRKIKGLINIAGFTHGSPLTFEESRTFFSTLRLRLLGLLTGIEQKTLNELLPEFQNWQGPWNLPESIQVINLLPLPLSSHIQPSFKRRYKVLMKYGPNDGMTPLWTSLQLPGSTVPLWGADHFCRTPDTIQIMYQVFNYIVRHPSLRSHLESKPVELSAL